MISGKLLAEQHAIEVTIKTVIDLTLSIFMIRLFCSKLLEVALEVNPTDWHGLIGIAAKISILALFALITTQIMFLSISIDAINLMVNGNSKFSNFIYYDILFTW